MTDAALIEQIETMGVEFHAGYRPSRSYTNNRKPEIGTLLCREIGGWGNHRSNIDTDLSLTFGGKRFSEVEVIKKPDVEGIIINPHPEFSFRLCVEIKGRAKGKK